MLKLILMKIGSLTEQELTKITELLDQENIRYQTGVDQEVMDQNKESMQFSLRHYNSPSISSSLLMIQLEESAFEKMSGDLKAKLLDFGITDEIPEGLEFPEEIENLNNQVNKQKTKTLELIILRLLAAAAILYCGYIVFKNLDLSQ